MKHEYVRFLDSHGNWLQILDGSHVNMQHASGACTLRFHFPEYDEVKRIAAIHIAFEGECTTAIIKRISKQSWGPESIIPMYNDMVDIGTMLAYYADHLYILPHTENYLTITVNGACKVYVEAVSVE